jgi:hypothetical protein
VNSGITAARLAEIRATDAQYGFNNLPDSLVHQRRELLQLVDGIAAQLTLRVRGWRAAAHSLRSEVEQGITLRQSAEAKLARAEVLDAVADELTRVLDELGVDGAESAVAAAEVAAAKVAQ